MTRRLSTEGIPYAIVLYDVSPQSSSVPRGVSRRTIKCPTTYSNGPWFDEVAGNRGNAELIVRWALFYIKTEPAIQGGFSCVTET